MSRELGIAVEAERIAGWMSREELIWLAKNAENKERILEIGTWQGRSTYAICKGTSGKVITLDNLYGEPDAPFDPEELEELIHYNLREFLTYERKLKFLPITTAKFYDTYPDLKFDMIFIDGSHEFTDVIFDCSIAQQMALEGALICGHDWFMPKVQRAVRKVFPLAQPAHGTSIWYTHI